MDGLCALVRMNRRVEEKREKGMEWKEQGREKDRKEK